MRPETTAAVGGISLCPMCELLAVRRCSGCRRHVSWADGLCLPSEGVGLAADHAERALGGMFGDGFRLCPIRRLEDGLHGDEGNRDLALAWPSFIWSPC